MYFYGLVFAITTNISVVSTPPKIFIWQAIVRRPSVSTEGLFFRAGHSEAGRRPSSAHKNGSLAVREKERQNGKRASKIEVTCRSNSHFQPVISQLHSFRQRTIDFRMKPQLVADMCEVSPGDPQFLCQVDGLL